MSDVPNIHGTHQHCRPKCGFQIMIKKYIPYTRGPYSKSPAYVHSWYSIFTITFCFSSWQIIIVVAQWRSGAVAQWRSGAVAQWRSGAVAQWRSGAVAQWRSGAVAQWRSGYNFELSTKKSHVRILCCRVNTRAIYFTLYCFCLLNYVNEYLAIYYGGYL